jgi:hypothetical protein
MFLNWNFRALRLRSPMDRLAAIKQAQDACNTIGVQFMKIHPTLPHLGDDELRSETIKTLHEMTVKLEVIKKRLIKLQHRDDSAEL